MTWITPKTNWISADRFDADDYNRISGNINYLQDHIINLYTEYVQNNLETDKTYDQFIYARHMNGVEDELKRIADQIKATYASKSYSANGYFWDYAELNRIESSILNAYNVLTNTTRYDPSLKLVVGRKTFGREVGF